MKIITTGNNNTAIGESSLKTTQQDIVTLLFTLKLEENTTGYNKKCSWLYSLQINTTGYNNTAMGYQALEANKTGNNTCYFLRL